MIEAATLGLDWVAAAVTLLAVELVTRRYWQGFALHALNGVLWGYLMVRAQLWGLVALEAVFVTQSVVAAVRWYRRREDTR